MATPYAGRGHGMHMPLLAGTEVLVAFRDGLPDEPVITAAVPDSENPSLVNHQNPYQHHIRSAAGNHIQLSDRTDQQSVWISCPAHHTAIGLGALSPPDHATPSNDPQDSDSQPASHATNNPNNDKTDSSTGGFYHQSSGSSVEVAAGSRNEVLAGSAESVRLGHESGMLIGAGSSIKVLAAMEFNIGHSVQWVHQPIAGIGEGTWSQAAPSCEFHGDTRVTRTTIVALASSR